MKRFCLSRGLRLCKWLRIFIVLSSTLGSVAFLENRSWAQSANSSMGLWEVNDEEFRKTDFRSLRKLGEKTRQYRVRRSVDMGMRFSFPDGFGLDLSWRFHSYLSAQIYASSPMLIKVSFPAKGRTLMKRSSYAIRQPSLRIPIKAEFGPSLGAGLSVHPFRGGFFVSTGLQQRVIRLSSEAESPVEIVDPDSRTFSNSRLYATAETETRQVLAQASVGHRYGIFKHNLYVAWSAGFSKPLSSQSSQKVDLEVINPRASRGAEVVADNFSEIELEEEAKAEKGLSELLEEIEDTTTPFITFCIGWRW